MQHEDDIRPITWQDGAVRIIDQTALPKLTRGFCGSLATPISMAARALP